MILCRRCRCTAVWGSERTKPDRSVRGKCTVVSARERSPSAPLPSPHHTNPPASTPHGRGSDSFVSRRQPPPPSPPSRSIFARFSVSSGAHVPVLGTRGTGGCDCVQEVGVDIVTAARTASRGFLCYCAALVHWIT